MATKKQLKDYYQKLSDKIESEGFDYYFSVYGHDYENIDPTLDVYAEMFDLAQSRLNEYIASKFTELNIEGY